MAMVSEMESGAIFSEDRDYRYVLWRKWDSGFLFGEKDRGKVVAFHGLNPSTADERKNDPTVTRWIGYAKAWGFTAMFVVNLFGLRSTFPEGLYQALEHGKDPVGPENDRWIREISEKVALNVACWGVHGGFMDRGKAVREMVPGFHVLGLTREGFPKHPLRQRKDLKPVEWR
ncbi:MAG: DUF1643 domain-containing protein [Desulfobacteraceae bacterium]|nr:MAG: DUF1643 domain-containing protein [Desulfobacteraceae bacterium]